MLHDRAPMRDPREDPELLTLVRRYVLPGRRYLKLGGPLLRMEEGEYGRFLRALREDAEVVTAEEIGVLLEGGWRERRTAAWLVAVGGRTEFRERVGGLLLESQVCCAGLAYAVVLAGFGTGRDAELLAAYLERYLRRPDLGYDQAVVWGGRCSTSTVTGRRRWTVCGGSGCGPRPTCGIAWRTPGRAT